MVRGREGWESCRRLKCPYIGVGILVPFARVLFDRCKRDWAGEDAALVQGGESGESIISRSESESGSGCSVVVIKEGGVDDFLRNTGRRWKGYSSSSAEDSAGVSVGGLGLERKDCENRRVCCVVGEVRKGSGRGFWHNSQLR